MTVLLAVDYLEEHWQFYYFIADLYTVYGEMFAPVLFSHIFRPNRQLAKFYFLWCSKITEFMSGQI